MIIDISNEVYTNIKNTVISATVLPTYPSTTPTFPCVTVEEIVNTTNKETVDSNGENYNDCSFEINIFSEGNTKVSDAKAIRDTIDGIMSEQYGMNRDFSAPTPNFLDTNVYKYTLRYSFTISKDKIIYRR